jgi:hypothetical protein
MSEQAAVNSSEDEDYILFYRKLLHKAGMQMPNGKIQAGTLEIETEYKNPLYAMLGGLDDEPTSELSRMLQILEGDLTQTIPSLFRTLIDETGKTQIARTLIVLAHNDDLMKDDYNLTNTLKVVNAIENSIHDETLKSIFADVTGEEIEKNTKNFEPGPAPAAAGGKKHRCKK